MIPDALDGWTLPKIQEIAADGIAENDRFDLKTDLQPADHQRKTVAAFANSDGGFLVFGVTNDRRVEGVANEELVRDFGSKLREGLSPSVDFRFARRSHALPTGRFVYVAHVPRSHRGPHGVYANGAWTFLKRTAAGSNDPMTYEEIRAAFTNARERQRQLAWLKAEVQRLRVLAEKMGAGAPTASTLSRLATRFDLGQLRAVRLARFDDLGGDTALVSFLDQLEEHCASTNELLSPMAALSALPRSPRPTNNPYEALPFAMKRAEQIVVVAGRVLAILEKLPP